MRRLTSPIRDYAWGSRTAIASLQRRPVPSAHPEAELWMGAHPSAPSLLPEPGPPVPLTEVIAGDPERVLGPDVLDRFGPRLPYLLKILAAARPLSLQAHPDAEQARLGFAAESGPARDGRNHPARDERNYSARDECNYSDPYHKPELLVAVEPFDALCGFRDPEVSAAVLESFDLPALRPLVATLRSGSASPAARLRRAVELLMAWPAPQRPELVALVARAGRTRAGALAATRPADAPEAAGHGLAALLGGLYPGDIGVLEALLLNQVRLRPDEAVFMPAGNPHTYLRGLGVEVMAASDNVVRGGLTPKRVDVPELLRVLRYEVLADPVVRPETLAPGLWTWRVPVAEFGLVKAVADAASGPVGVPGTGPRIVVCLNGPASLRAGDRELTVGSGEAVFVPATEPPVRIAGAGAVVFQAGPGPSPADEVRP